MTTSEPSSTAIPHANTNARSLCGDPSTPTTVRAAQGEPVGRTTTTGTVACWATYWLTDPVETVTLRNPHPLPVSVHLELELAAISSSTRRSRSESRARQVAEPGTADQVDRERGRKLGRDGVP